MNVCQKQKKGFALIMYWISLNQTYDPSTFSSPEKTQRCPSIPLSPIFSCSPSPNNGTNNSIDNNVGDSVKKFLFLFKNKMTPRLKTQVLQHLFQMFITEAAGPDILQYIEKDL